MIDHCPACGSHVLYQVTLDYAGTEGFRPDAYGVIPELGDTIAGCGDCASFVIVDRDGNPAPAPAPGADQVFTVGQGQPPTLVSVPPLETEGGQ